MKTRGGGELRLHFRPRNTRRCAQIPFLESATSASNRSKARPSTWNRFAFKCPVICGADKPPVTAAVTFTLPPWNVTGERELEGAEDII